MWYIQFEMEGMMLYQSEGKYTFTMGLEDQYTYSI